MKRIAAPMIGGVISSFLLELLVYPVIYEVWRGWGMRRTKEGYV
jgi:Cu(I)/Ag(I) efflux system membrane protein CusA/SilA